MRSLRQGAAATGLFVLVSPGLLAEHLQVWAVLGAAALAAAVAVVVIR